MRDPNADWRGALNTILIFVLVLWGVQLLNFLLAYRLNAFGIYPLDVRSLPGLLFWPFLHGGFQHLIANSIPLLVMGYFVALRGLWTFLVSALIISIVGGLGVWIFARAAYHIGASGLVFGFFGFLVMLAFYERSFRAILIAAGTLFFYGGLIFGILPGQDYVSWEGHLFGLLAGIFAAKLLASKQAKRN